MGEDIEPTEEAAGMLTFTSLGCNKLIIDMSGKTRRRGSRSPREKPYLSFPITLLIVAKSDKGILKRAALKQQWKERLKVELWEGTRRR
jgi:hypothetical protein